MSLKFQRNMEDFTCENCKVAVKGSGYTNHCPKCLWSKHVDNYPGDRINLCKGLMEPIGLIRRDGKDSIIHKCIKCGFEGKNVVSKYDDQETLIEISKGEIN